MPFIGIAVFGLTAAVVFLITAALEANDGEWLASAAFGVLGLAFATRYVPKFLIFRWMSLASLPLLAGGVVLFAVFIRERFGG